MTTWRSPYCRWWRWTSRCSASGLRAGICTRHAIAATGPRHVALPGGVSRARSAACAFRRWRSIPIVIGCAPPSTRRAVGNVSSSVVTASRTSSSVAAVSQQSASAYLHLILSVTSASSPATRCATGIVLRISDLASSKRSRLIKDDARLRASKRESLSSSPLILRYCSASPPRCIISQFSWCPLRQ